MQVRRSLRPLGDDFRYAWLAGILMAAATLLIAWLEDLPIRDPDSLIPGYIRFPAIVLGAISIDIVPRALWQARRAPRTLWSVTREITRERWPASHWRSTSRRDSPIRRRTSGAASHSRWPPCCAVRSTMCFRARISSATRHVR